MKLDLDKRSVDRRTDTRPGTGRVPEETHNVHYALHKLGLCRVSSRTIFQQEEEILGMVLGFQNRCSVRGTMEPTVVVTAHGLESHIGK